jgi:hypothetical protein
MRVLFLFILLISPFSADAEKESAGFYAPSKADVFRFHAASDEERKRNIADVVAVTAVIGISAAIIVGRQVYLKRKDDDE